MGEFKRYDDMTKKEKRETVTITLTKEELSHVLERMTDDDFFHQDEVAQNIVKRLKALIPEGIEDA